MGFCVRLIFLDIDSVHTLEFLFYLPTFCDDNHYGKWPVDNHPFVHPFVSRVHEGVVNVYGNGVFVRA